MVLCIFRKGAWLRSRPSDSRRSYVTVVSSSPAFGGEVGVQRGRSSSRNFPSRLVRRTALTPGLADLHPSPHRHSSSRPTTPSSSPTPPKWLSTLPTSPSARAPVSPTPSSIIGGIGTLTLAQRSTSTMRRGGSFTATATGCGRYVALDSRILRLIAHDRAYPTLQDRQSPVETIGWEAGRTRRGEQVRGLTHVIGPRGPDHVLAQLASVYVTDQDTTRIRAASIRESVTDRGRIALLQPPGVSGTIRPWQMLSTLAQG
jgi:hypothetical protein